VFETSGRPLGDKFAVCLARHGVTHRPGLPQCFGDACFRYGIARVREFGGNVPDFIPQPFPAFPCFGAGKFSVPGDDNSTQLWKEPKQTVHMNIQQNRNIA